MNTSNLRLTFMKQLHVKTGGQLHTRVLVDDILKSSGIPSEWERTVVDVLYAQEYIILDHGRGVGLSPRGLLYCEQEF